MESLTPSRAIRHSANATIQRRQGEASKNRHTHTHLRKWSATSEREHIVTSSCDDDGVINATTIVSPVVWRKQLPRAAGIHTRSHSLSIARQRQLRASEMARPWARGNAHLVQRVCLTLKHLCSSSADMIARAQLVPTQLCVLAPGLTRHICAAAAATRWYNTPKRWPAGTFQAESPIN